MDILNDEGTRSRASLSLDTNNNVRQTRVSAAINPNYEQVSIKQIVSRFKDKSHKRRKSLKLEDELTSAKEDVEERAEYYLEAPKSGLLNKEEVIQPLFLPTASDSFDISLSSNIENSKPSSGKKLEEIRNLVYCSDTSVLEDYRARLQSKGVTAKQHFGLSFDSNFESGNLFQAESVVRKGAPLGAPEEYDLFLSMDLSSHAALYPRCGQWFFFRIQNTKSRLYRFNIHFLTNGKIGYLDGKRPIMISEAAFNGMDKEGWKQCGEEIVYEECYQRPLMYREREEYPDLDGPARPHLYKLSFTFSLKHAKDTVYFAYEVPYTFTQLQNFIYVLSKNPFNRKHLQIRTLCRSLAGNRTDILVITEDSNLTRLELLERDDNGEVVNAPYSLKDVLPSSISALSGAQGHNHASGANHNRPTTGTSHVSSVTSVSHSTAPSSTAANQTHRLQHSAHGASTHELPTAHPTEETFIPKFLMKLQTEIEEQREKDRRLRIEKARKPAIVMLGRLHPNETCSSWICEGIVRYLLSENATAKLLRERFVFYIVPMMNIDGVVNGYARHDIVGYDMTTQFANPSPVLHPSLFGIKHVIRRLQATTRIAGFFDIRGHSHRSGFSFHTQLSSPRMLNSSASNHQAVTTSPTKNKANSGNADATDPENFDPRLFYYAAARRCKYVSLKNCHVSRHIPHYPQVTEHHLSYQDYHNHHHHHQASSTHAHGVKKYEWWQSKDASAREVVSHQFHVGLSVTVEASTYRSMLPSNHSKNVKYLSPADYAVFGSQLCLSLIDIYLSNDLETQNRLSNTSFMISPGKRASMVNKQNMAEILQHLPAMLDLDEDADENGEKANPYETATAEVIRPTRKPRYKSALTSRISFNIGSSEVDEHLKRLSSDVNSEGHKEEETSLLRKSEIIELDHDDMQRVDYFNEDLWEHDSQASSDADEDHANLISLFQQLQTPGANNALLHLQDRSINPVNTSHSNVHVDDRLNFLQYQSHDVVLRSGTNYGMHPLDPKEHPPLLWQMIRRAEYLGLIAPKPTTAELIAEEGKDDDEDEATKHVAPAAAISNTEHVFRMGATPSSFKPIKVMTHSDRLAAAIAEKQHLQQQIQQQLQTHGSDWASVGEISNAMSSGTSVASSSKTGATRDFDDEDDDDDDNGSAPVSNKKQVNNGRRNNSAEETKSNRRQSKLGQGGKKSLIQFAYVKPTGESKTSTDDNAANAVSSDTDKIKSNKFPDKTSEDEGEINGFSAKAAIQRVTQLKNAKRAGNSTIHATLAKKENQEEEPSSAGTKFSPRARTTIAVIPNTTSTSDSTVSNKLTASTSATADPAITTSTGSSPTSLLTDSKGKSGGGSTPRSRRKTTNATPASTTSATTVVGSNPNTLSLAPVPPQASQPMPQPIESRPRMATTVVIQRVPIIKEEPSEETVDVHEIPSSSIVSPEIAAANSPSPPPGNSSPSSVSHNDHKARSPRGSYLKSPRRSTQHQNQHQHQQKEKEKHLHPQHHSHQHKGGKAKEVDKGAEKTKEELIPSSLDGNSLDHFSVPSSVTGAGDHQDDGTVPTTADAATVPIRNAMILATAIPPPSQTTSIIIEHATQVEKEPTFSEQLTSVIEKAVHDTPSLAFAPAVSESYKNLNLAGLVTPSAAPLIPIKSPTMSMMRPFNLAPLVINTVDPSTIKETTAPVSVIVPFTELSSAEGDVAVSSSRINTKPIMSTMGTQTDVTEEENVSSLPVKGHHHASESTKPTVPSIAFSAYPGDLPAGYTPQKRRGRRAMSIINHQFAPDPSNSQHIPRGPDTAMTVQQIQVIAAKVAEEDGEKEAVVTLPIDDSLSVEPKEVIKVHCEIPVVSVEKSETPPAAATISSAKAITSTKVPESPVLPVKMKKRQLDTKNPLLLKNYDGDIASADAVSNKTTIPTFDNEIDLLEGTFPALPSLSGLSNDQLQRAILYASVKQKEQNQIQEEASATSAMVLPLVSATASLPKPLKQHHIDKMIDKILTDGTDASENNTNSRIHSTTTNPERLHIEQSKQEKEDEEDRQDLEKLGKTIQHTEARVPFSTNSPFAAAAHYPYFLDTNGKRQQFTDDDDDEDAAHDILEEDEDAYDYDPYASRSGANTTRGILSSSANKHRKRRVQIIREYLHSHYGANDQTFFATEVPPGSTHLNHIQQDNGSTFSDNPYERTVINEEGHRVYLISQDHPHYHEKMSAAAQHETRDEQSASMVAASLQEWRDHHHKPLAKTLAVSFVTPAMAKLTEAELDARRLQESRQKCFRELGLTYDYVFGGIGALKNRPPPEVYLNKSEPEKAGTEITSTRKVTNPVQNAASSDFSLLQTQANPQQQQQNTMFASTANIAMKDTKLSTSLPAAKEQQQHTLHRPLGPRGTFHRGFPQRGGPGRRYEMSYATDSAAYRLHAYYQHILQELKRRNLVAQGDLEATATQLFETVLRDPLRQQPQVPVKFSSTAPVQAASASKGSASAANVDMNPGNFQLASTTSAAAGMSLSVSLVPPSKQLTPYRRFLKRPQLAASYDSSATNNTPAAAAAADDEEKQEHKRTKEKKKTDTSDVETEAMRKSRLLQERLQRLAIIQAETSRSIRKEQAHYLPNVDHADEILPEWLSLSPRLRQQFLAGQSVQYYQENPDAPRTNKKASVPWFHTASSSVPETTTTAATAAAGKVSKQEKKISISLNTEKLEKVVEEKLPKSDASFCQDAVNARSLTSIVFDDENEANEVKYLDENGDVQDAGGEDNSEDELHTDRTRGDNQDDEDMNNGGEQQKSPVVPKTSAKIQTLQLFSGFDVLVPPVQWQALAAASTAAGKDKVAKKKKPHAGTTDSANETTSFQDQIRKTLLSKYRAYQEQQRQFQQERLKPTQHGKNMLLLSLPHGPNNHANSSLEYENHGSAVKGPEEETEEEEEEEEEEDNYHNRLREMDDEEKHEISVTRFRKQLDYLATGDSSLLLPESSTKTSPNRSTAHVLKGGKKVSVVDAFSDVFFNDSIHSSKNSSQLLQQQSPRPAAAAAVGQWLHYHSGKSAWRAEDALPTSTPQDNPTKSLLPMIGITSLSMPPSALTGPSSTAPVTTSAANPSASNPPSNRQQQQQHQQQQQSQRSHRRPAAAAGDIVHSDDVKVVVTATSAGSERSWTPHVDMPPAHAPPSAAVQQPHLQQEGSRPSSSSASTAFVPQRPSSTFTKGDKDQGKGKKTQEEEDVFPMPAVSISAHASNGVTPAGSASMDNSNTVVQLSPRLSDIQRLTAAMAASQQQSQQQQQQDKGKPGSTSSSSSLAASAAPAMSAIALEVAARRPGGKKILLVQKQMVPVGSDNNNNSGEKASILHKGNNSSGRKANKRGELRFRDDEDDYNTENNTSTLKPSSFLDHDHTATSHFTEEEDAHGNLKKKAVIVIRAASSIESVEKERSRAGAVGRLLIGNSSSNNNNNNTGSNNKTNTAAVGGEGRDPHNNHDAVVVHASSTSSGSNNNNNNNNTAAAALLLQPMRPAMPRPTSHTTTTGGSSSSNNNDPATTKTKTIIMKNPQKQKLRAESLIDQIRQSPIV